MNKVTICHWANGHPHTITVAEPAASNHIDHAGIGVPGHEEDTLGECPTTSTSTSSTTTTSTTSSSTTTTTIPNPVTPPVSGEPGSGPTPLPHTPAPDATNTQPTISTTPQHQTPFLGCGEYVTNIEQGGCSPAPTTTTTVSEIAVTPVRELPATGGELTFLPIGLALVALGVACRRLARR